MEISMMVAQLKSEAESVENELQTKIAREKTLRLSLAALESEIKAVTDKRDAILGAIERLGKVCDGDVPVGGVHAIHVPAKHKPHSTKARRVGKFDASGNKIGEYPSILQAAKAFGWGNVPMTKYIQNESKEKQIRLRGFYLEFIAS